jgi:hypothetical protein
MKKEVIRDMSGMNSKATHTNWLLSMTGITRCVKKEFKG